MNNQEDARVLKYFRGELTGEGVMRWRQGGLGEASALDSREWGGFRTTLVTLEVADVKQFDCPRFFCEDVSPLRSIRDLQFGCAAIAAGRSLGMSREVGAGGPASCKWHGPEGRGKQEPPD